MVPALRRAFNDQFTPACYAGYVASLERRCRTHIEFRLSETPCFLPADLVGRLGEAADEFAATLSPGVPHEIDGTLDKAVAAATRDAEASPSREPVVLLSPACASFDQYRNFEVRGDAFRDLVRALPGLTPIKK